MNKMIAMMVFGAFFISGSARADTDGSFLTGLQVNDGYVEVGETGIDPTLTWEEQEYLLGVEAGLDDPSLHCTLQGRHVNCAAKNDVFAAPTVKGGVGGTKARPEWHPTKRGMHRPGADKFLTTCHNTTWCR